MNLCALELPSDEISTETLKGRKQLDGKVKHHGKLKNEGLVITSSSCR